MSSNSNSAYQDCTYSTLLATRNVAKQILVENNPTRLIERVCVSLKETVGCLNAWIALFNDREVCETTSVSSGLGNLSDTIGEALGRGEPPDCMTAALACETTVVVEDPGKHCLACPLAKSMHCSYALSQRLAHEGRTFGVLTFCLPSGQVHTQEMPALIKEIAGDLSLALHRINTSESLRQREARFRAIFENNPSVIVVVNPENATIVDINSSAEFHYGWTRENLVGKNLGELNVLPADRLADEMQSALKGRCRRFEFRHHRADGSIRDFEVRTGHSDVQGKAMLFATIDDITDRKLAEEDLRRAHQRLELAVAAGGVGLWDVDCQTGQVWYSTEWKRQLGYEEHEISDNMEEWQGRLHPNDRESTLCRIAALVAEGHTEYPIEFRLRHKNGTFLWILSRTRLFRDDAGRLLRAVGSHLDITDRKQAEDALRDTLSRLEMAVAAGRVGLWDWDLETNTVRYSAEWKRQIGYADHEIGDSFEEWRGRVHPDDLGPTLSKVEAFIAQTSPSFEAEFRLRHKDGSYRWILTQASVIKNEQGRPVRVLGSHVDITEQKRTEAEREPLLRAIEQTGDSIFITDSGGNIQYVNPAFERFTGYTRDEVVGQNPRILKSGLHGEEFYRQLWQTIAGGQTWRGRLVSRRKDGELHTEDATISPIIDANGVIVNYICCKSDITAQLILEEQYRQAQKMESVGRLAGGVAHDFNNMLSVILGYTQLAINGLGKEHEILSLLLEVEAATHRSADLTRQLLAFARQQPIAPVVTGVNQIVDGMIKMLRRLIGENIDLVWLPSSDLRPIKIDPSQIDQILANLCVNARDAVKGVGKVTIETYNTVLDTHYCALHQGFAPGEYVTIAVSDNGCGMDPGTLAHIFEPFYTTKGPGQGTGLGLATVYGIVKQNHGFINVYSEKGVGTTFKIYLPRNESGEATFEGESEKDGIPPGAETILIVEDEPAILDMSRRLLEEVGYDVLTTETPNEALSLAEDHLGEIHLLLTDVIMPQMNGRDLACKIRALNPCMKCLFMSGYTANVIAHHGVLEEGVDFIEKPFTLQGLAAKVRQVLDAKPKRGA